MGVVGFPVNCCEEKLGHVVDGFGSMYDGLVLAFFVVDLQHLNEIGPSFTAHLIAVGGYSRNEVVILRRDLPRSLRRLKELSCNIAASMFVGALCLRRHDLLILMVVLGVKSDELTSNITVGCSLAWPTELLHKRFDALGCCVLRSCEKLLGFSAISDGDGGVLL